ncbi:uncharacterized protein V1510DRAFT_418819 [Dipodascopsis tothii]|uniref:uncharacterized protein n=1 Tax=Dipodascopsis tothii TaxID=44089 RepID=UPI0034CF7981
MAQTLLAIKYQDQQLEILDQLRLPHESVYVKIQTAQDGFDAIRSMTVRGAPAIAIVAALSLAVELAQTELGSAEAERALILQRLAFLVESRPTAVNLANAARALGAVVEAAPADAAAIRAAYTAAAERMLADDVADNRSIGDNGLAWARATLGADRFGVLTICNTGSLATAGYGTALGIIRSLHTAGVLDHAYALETRPYNQGSRLTAYELVYEKIPATLVTDSMASVLLKTHPEIKMVVVGADRVAANGDTTNKIGTYQLAITARYHGVKFVVAAPTTSIDFDTPDGSSIVIEHRKPHELVTLRGPVVRDDGSLDVDDVRTVHVAAPGIDVWNPAFDIAPAELIDAIVTEKGVAVKDADGRFHLDRL